MKKELTPYICTNCGKKLSKFKNFFKKYPIGVSGVFSSDPNETISKDLQFCDTKCQIEYIEKMQKEEIIDKSIEIQEEREKMIKEQDKIQKSIDNNNIESNLPKPKRKYHKKDKQTAINDEDINKLTDDEVNEIIGDVGDNNDYEPYDPSQEDNPEPLEQGQIQTETEPLEPTDEMLEYAQKEEQKREDDTRNSTNPV